MSRRWTALLLLALLLPAVGALARFGGGGNIPAPPAVIAGWFAADESNFTIGSHNYGSTGVYYNGTTHAPWANTNGDWIDKNGLPQGTVSYASGCSGGLTSGCSSPNTGSTPQTWVMPITQLVQEAVASSNHELEVILRASAGRTIAAKTTGTPPSVLVTYTDTSTDTLACLDNVLLGGSSLPVRTGPFNIATFPLALHFAMPNSGKTVSTAVMTVTNLVSSFAATTPFVGRVNDPLFPNGVDGLGVHLGVANNYTQDVGLGADPSVYFFSDGSSVSAAFTQSSLDGSSVTAYDYGPAPDLAKLPWAIGNKFQLQTDAGIGVVTLTGTATSGSPIVTGLSSTASVLKGFWAYDGTFAKLNLDSKILSVDSGSQVTLTQNALASGSVSIKFIPGTNTITKSGNLHSNTLIDGIADTSDLTNGMIVFAVEGKPSDGAPAISFSGSATITIVDAHTLTLGTSAAATISNATLIFLPPTPTFSFGTTPVVVPSTYTGHGYTPLGASTGSAFMIRHEKGMETIADYEYRFHPTTDGNQASTYVPGAVADGSNVVIRKTSNLTNAISTVDSTPTVTIHDVGHGASPGDWINFPFQVSIAGIILHDWYPIASVIDADNYTITSTGAWWYGGGAGSQATANATVTNGGVTATLSTISGAAGFVVTLPDHVQYTKSFDEFYINGGNISLGGLTLTNPSAPATYCSAGFDSDCSEYNVDPNFTVNTFTVYPHGLCSGVPCSPFASSSAGPTSLNSGQVQIRYATGTPWPAGKLPNEIYVRWYMMLGSDFIAPDNAQCNGGKWALGTAHRTTVATNNGACAQCSPAVKAENHYAGGSGWSTRGQFIMGDTPVGPEYQKTVIGNYEYDYNHCQSDTMAGILATLTPGVWHSVEVHTKMNTFDVTGLSTHGAAPTDGLIETFIDGRLALTKAYKWREEPPWNPMLPNQIQVIGDNGIKSVWFNSYFGGVCGIGFDAAFFVKNITIGTSYIGPMKM